MYGAVEKGSLAVVSVSDWWVARFAEAGISALSGSLTNDDNFP
jgi:hypothetical protein